MLGIFSEGLLRQVIKKKGMHGKALFFLTFICIFQGLFVSCDGDFLVNELKVKSSSDRGKGETSNVIMVSADIAGKLYDADNPQPDPALTYTCSPDPLPDGVSITGELVRDPGEYVGTYVIRQGTVKLAGDNAGKYTLKYIGNRFYINYD